MWDSFWPDLVVALISSSLTVLIAFMTYLLNRRRDQRNDVQFLIDDLAHRRAFAGKGVYVRDASRNEDFRRASASVLAARDEIRVVRSRAGSGPNVQRALSEMTRACNYYLEMSERDPNSYAEELVELRHKLADGIYVLARLRKVRVSEPGSLAFGNGVADQ